MIGAAIGVAVLALLLAAMVKVAAYGRRLNLERVLAAAEAALDNLDTIEEAVNLAVPDGIDDARAVAAARMRMVKLRAEALDVAKRCRQELAAKGVKA